MFANNPFKSDQWARALASGQKGTDADRDFNPIHSIDPPPPPARTPPAWISNFKLGFPVEMNTIISI